MFITFEGIDGAGKSTQISILSKYLKKMGVDHITTREPGGVPVGEKIRAIFKNEPLQDKSELLLLYASRLEHVKRLIQPNNYKLVISDRFDDSTLAYQHYGRGIPLEDIKMLRKFTIGDFKPDITFLIDLHPDDMENRTRNRKLDKMELENIQFYSRVARGYREIAKKSPDRIVVIDGKQSIGKISTIIRERVEKELGI